MSDLVSEMGIASARIYAAFGSKEDLFREAVLHYEAQEGGFATRALAEEPTARGAIERMLRDAAATYTRPGKPRGCMVVTAATNMAKDNDPILDWLTEHRRARTEAIVARLQRAAQSGELATDTDVQALGDLFAALMNGISVQSRDGVSKERLLAVLPLAMDAFDRHAPPSRTRRR